MLKPASRELLDTASDLTSEVAELLTSGHNDVESLEYLAKSLRHIRKVLKVVIRIETK